MGKDYIKHYGVSGTNWYVHKFGNWERHAKYANGQPNPETNGSKGPYSSIKSKYEHLTKKFDKKLRQRKYGSIPIKDSDVKPKMAYFGQMLSDVSDEVKNKVMNIDKTSGLKKKWIETTKEQDMAKVNPLYNSKFPDTMRNCMYCTTAYELRRRGYDVQANTNTSDPEGFYAESIQKWFPDAKVKDIADAKDILSAKGKLSNYAYGANIYNPVISRTVKTLKNQGDGARGILLVGWKEGWGGHALSYDVTGDKVNIIDSQSNKLYDRSLEILGLLNGCQNTKYVRLDRVDFDPNNIKEAVR